VRKRRIVVLHYAEMVCGGEGEDKVGMVNRIGDKDVGVDDGAAGVDVALVGRIRSGWSIRSRGRGGISVSGGSCMRKRRLRIDRVVKRVVGGC